MQNYLVLQLLLVTKSISAVSKTIPMFMRLAIVLITLFTGTLQATNIYSQTTLLNIDAKDQPVKNVLEEIEKQSNFNFFYNNKKLDVQRKVSVKAEKAKVFAVLDQIFDGADVSYSVLDNNIILSTKKTSTSRTAEETIKISGTVSDENGETIIGANIQVKGATIIGTMTDMDGAFNLNVPENATLVISCIGYETKEIIIMNKTILNITLNQDMDMLDELVVVGYGTQTRSSLTSSIVEIKGSQLTNLPVTNISRAIASYVPGVTASGTLSEAPGGSTDLNIRGMNSINNSSPLVLIDGIEGSLNSINPNDVASISVLKDAASTAIYGARAAGGVFLITTKMGSRDSKVKINYMGSYSNRQAAFLAEQLDGLSYIEYRILGENNAGMSSEFDYPELLAALKDPSIIDIPAPRRPLTHLVGTSSVDFIEETLGSANMHDHSISVTGGGEKLSFLLSAGYLQEDALFKHGDFGFRRYNLRSNVNVDFTERISLGLRMSYSNSQDDQPVEGWNAVVTQAHSSEPNNPVKWSTGDWAGNNSGNPIHDLVDGGHTISTTDRLEISGNLNIDLAKGLTWNTVFGGSLVNLEKSADYKSILRYSVKPNVVIGKKHLPNSKQMNHARTLYKNVQSYITYDITPNERHNIKLMVGGAYEDQGFSTFYAKREEFLDNNLMNSVDLGIGNQYSGANLTEWGIASVFGRLNYSYDRRYFLEVSFRTDASSRFIKSKRWGVFPSVSASWNIINEPFMKTQNIFSELKLRASWGNSGNQNSIGLYDYLAQMTIGSDYYPLGTSNDMAKYVLQEALASPSRSWETVSVKNLALDFGFFENRLTGVFEYYIKDNKNMLIPVDIPSVIGMTVPTFNSGALRVWGWEGTLSWKDRVNNDFSYGVTFTLQDSKNKITEFAGSKNMIAGLQNVEGYPIGSYFGYKSDGYFQSKEEVENHAFQHLLNDAGDVKYIDLDGNGKIDSGDLAHLGDNSLRYIYNIGISLQYKGFDLEMLFDGVGKKNNLLEKLSLPTSRAVFVGQTDGWTPENRDAQWPRVYKNANWNYWTSDYIIHDASYFSMKNLQLGYTLPEKWVNRILVDRLRLYVNVRNPFVVDNFTSFLDPRLDSYNQYPVLSSYTFGLNLTF